MTVTIAASEGRTGARLSAQREALWAACSMLLSGLVAAWALRLWEWDLNTPFELQGDAIWVAMETKDAVENGWYWHNPDLAYPFGQFGSLFPELNVLHLGIVKLLSYLFQSPFAAAGIYFVLGFPLAALTMHLLARQQRIAPPAALAIAVLFSCAAGHQEQFGHLWLSAYWVLPLGVWVVLEVLRGRPLLPPTGGPKWRSRITMRSAFVVASLTVIGLSGVYYVAFLLILLGISAIGRRITGTGLRDWVPGLGSAMYMLIVLSIPLLMAKAGSSGAVMSGPPPTNRSFAESETFAGKLMDLVLPWPGHQLDALAHLTWAYNAVTTSTVEVAALGIVGVAGAWGLAAVAMKTLLGVKSSERLRHWALLSGTAFAFYIVGGLGSFTALFFVSVVRTWSRMSLILLLFALLSVGYWITRLAARRGALVGLIVATTVMATGVMDQVNPKRAPNHIVNASRFAALKSYTATLEERTGPGCPIFQLPVTQFPESSGSGDMAGYDQLVPYLASKTLRWSSGAIRNTAESEWQRAVPLTDVRQLSSDLAATGFCAIEVDTAGFDANTDPRQLLARELGPPVAQTSDQRYVAFKIPRALASEGSKSRLLRPLLVTLDGYPPLRDRGGVRQPVGSWTSLRIVNLSHERVSINISMKVTPIGPQSRDLDIKSDTGAAVLAKTLHPTLPNPIDFSVSAGPGTTKLAVSLSGDLVRSDAAGGPATVWISEMSVSGGGPALRATTLQEQLKTGTVTPN